MTGFCGVLVRDGALAQEGKALFNRAKAILSRNPDDEIQVYSDDRFFLATYDNGAYEQDRRINIDQNNETVSWVSGDALVVARDGIDNNPAGSSAAIAEGMSGDDMSALARAAGMFTAVSWSRASGTLRLATDKLALRPLYLYLDSRFAIFATNLRTLRNTVPALALDEDGIAEAIYLRPGIAGRTVYRDIRRLQPAEVLSIDTKQANSKTYFDWLSIPRHEFPTTELAKHSFTAFMRAVKRRSRQDTADAFLSGGMDSRAVIAGLLDCGRTVRTFGCSFPDSADDIIGRMVAEAFGVEHTAHSRDPIGMMAGYTFLSIVSENFPRRPGSGTKGRLIWGGDGGSVGLGHVYLSEASVALTAGAVTDKNIHELFPSVRPWRVPILIGPLAREGHKRAKRSIARELEKLSAAAPDRRLFLFYLFNDQSRHLDNGFEDIDLTRIELIEPFFDSDFLEFIVASPIEPFLKHKLYNEWIKMFKTPAAAIPWQEYPGHEPCPHPLPKECRLQWSADWYAGRRVREIAERTAAFILNAKQTRAHNYLSYPWLRLLRVANRLGIERTMWQIWMMRRIFMVITGTTALEMTNAAAPGQDKAK